MFYPTFWDISTFVGTIGLFILLFFLFVRVLPMISIFEMRTMVPAARVKGPKDPTAHVDATYGGE